MELTILAMIYPPAQSVSHNTIHMLLLLKDYDEVYCKIRLLATWRGVVWYERGFRCPLVISIYICYLLSQ